LNGLTTRSANHPYAAPSVVLGNTALRKAMALTNPKTIVPVSERASRQSDWQVSICGEAAPTIAVSKSVDGNYCRAIYRVASVIRRSENDTSSA
jgi:hypothetical protein